MIELDFPEAQNSGLFWKSESVFWFKTDISVFHVFDNIFSHSIHDSSISSDLVFDFNVRYEAVLFCPYKLIWEIKLIQKALIKQDYVFTVKIYNLANASIIDVANILNEKIILISENKGVKIQNKNYWFLLDAWDSESKGNSFKFSLKTSFVYSIRCSVLHHSCPSKSSCIFIPKKKDFKIYDTRHKLINPFLLESIKSNYGKLLYR